MAVSGVGLFAATNRSESGPRQSYLVAARALPAGTRLTPSDLSLEPIDLPVGIRARAFDDRGVLAGTTLLAPLAAGELVQASNVVIKSTGSSSREISISVERGRIASGLAGGERVDLAATYGTGPDAYTIIVSRSALVVSIDRGRGGLGEAGPTVVTLGIDDPAEAVAIAHASQVAKITPLRTTGVVSPGATSPRDANPYRPPAVAPSQP